MHEFQKLSGGRRNLLAFRSASRGAPRPYNREQVHSRLPKAVSALLLAGLATLGAAATPAADTAGTEQQARRFLEVFGLLHRKLAAPFDPAAAIYGGALPAMLRTLDPHSAFLDPLQFESLREMQRSTEKGFGSVVNLLPGRVIVLQTLPGSPSARAGIAPGDEILVLNGQPLAHLPIEQLVALLGSARSREARVMVKRPSFTDLIEMSLVPAEMADPSVSRHFAFAPGVAFVKILNFESETARELREALQALGGRDLEGLVLDLRGNPGGVVEAAIQAAAFFLQPSDRILWVRGREGPKEELLVPAAFQPYEFPVRVLVDDRTASAAELVAGALQDHGRARVLGQRSFGKGLVQGVFELSGGSALALTTAYYETPSGRTIQRWLGACGQYQLAACDDGRSDEDLRGGIVPDRVVGPGPVTPFVAAMLSTNAFLEFAREHVGRGSGFDASYEPDNATLDAFQGFLAQRRIQPTLAEWSATLDYIRSMLKQEVLNLTVGVAAGDEVELRRDPVVLAAVRELQAERTNRSAAD